MRRSVQVARAGHSGFLFACSNVIRSRHAVRSRSIVSSVSQRHSQLSRTNGIPTSTLPDTLNKPYYVTTPIFYVNAAPHVGHFYTMVLADILVRWSRLSGRESILLTGTDEHGMKIQQAAAKAKTDPLPFCTTGAEMFQSLAADANVQYSRFIRTTDTDHRDAVQYAWNVLQDKGYIYKSKHEGWYSVSDETFYPQNAVHLIIERPTGRKIMASMDTGKEVEWTSETNYKFRLSAFRDKLLEHYAANPAFLRPVARMKALVQSVETGLEDLSVSRPSSRLNWGVQVPSDSSQTIYVWLDALMNYATMTGYPFAPGKDAGKNGWPPDVQIIGKDIIRFHCVYWPAFLMALDLPLPKQLLAHAHWTLGKEKMSKSTGNVVNPFFAIDRFGPDVMRYYLAHDGGLQDDADYGNENIITRYKKDLQGGLGNLASRITRGKKWSVAAVVQQAARGELRLDTKHAHWAQLERINSLRQAVDQNMAIADVPKAVKEITRLVYDTNAYMQQQEPWSLTDNKDRESQTRLSQIIWSCAEAIRVTGICMQAVMPDKSAALLDVLGVEATSRSLDFAKVGADTTYGTSTVTLGKGFKNALFPPLDAES